MERRKVVRVTETESELDNGAVYPHVVKLEQSPTVEDILSLMSSSSNRIYGRRSALDKKARKLAKEAQDGNPKGV